MSEKYTDEIVRIEFDLFDKVNNQGGRASCQDDFATFEIMRGAQFDAWNEKMRESYLDDLKTTMANDRNLVLEKYAYMTGYSYMGESETLEEKKRLVEEIMSIMGEWTVAMREKYPNVTRHSRPMSGEAGGLYPLDSYLMCELYTYSARTLGLFRDYLDELSAQGRSLPLMIMDNTVRRYGYKDMDDAESRMAG